MRRIIRIVLGSIFIGLGLAGLVLPILQGWLFLAVGSLLLAKDVPFFRRIWRWIKTRFPRIGRTAERLRKKFQKQK